MTEEGQQVAIEEEEEGLISRGKWADPSKIHVEQRSVNLGTLIGMLKGQQIVFDTEFQRAKGLWTKVEKSRLIESVLLGLPLPSFFFSEREESEYEWEIIDGLQRLSALQEFFVDKKLTLTNLDFLHEHEGKTYESFSPKERWRMDMLMVTLNVVTRQTPGDVKYMIFKRVNSVSYVLTPQEMRHALLHGRPAEYVKELAESYAFVNATANTTFRRMEDRELVTRYLAFKLQSYEGDMELNEFLFKGMELLKTLSVDDLNWHKLLFYEVLETANDIFMGSAFRKPSSNNRRNPISKALFDAVTITLSELTSAQRERLRSMPTVFNQEFEKRYKESDEFKRDLTTGTAQKAAVKRRWQIMREIIDSVL